MSAAASKPTLFAHPFVKWTGSKRQLVERVAELLVSTGYEWDEYREPFVGGESVFFHLWSQGAFASGKVAHLSDANARLVRTYRGVRDSTEEVIHRLGDLRYDPTTFADVRSMDPDECAIADHASVAVWFVYLNKTCFNGLYRTNKSGGFNVPFGRYTNPLICDAPNLRACARALADATVEVTDFETALAAAGPRTLVYCDPPYVPTSKTANFTSYGPGGFSESDHERLRDAAAAAGDRGARVVLSNSDAPLVRDLYSKRLGFRLHEVEVRRSTSSKVSTRGACRELLIEWVGT